MYSLLLWQWASIYMYVCQGSPQEFIVVWHTLSMGMSINIHKLLSYLRVTMSIHNIPTQ